jgi:hypothetical protein
MSYFNVAITKIISSKNKPKYADLELINTTIKVERKR